MSRSEIEDKLYLIPLSYIQMHVSYRHSTSSMAQNSNSPSVLNKIPSHYLQAQTGDELTWQVIFSGGNALKALAHFLTRLDVAVFTSYSTYILQPLPLYNSLC